MINQVLIIVALAVMIKSVANVLQNARATKWLKSYHPNLPTENKKDAFVFFILPVCHEENAILKVTDYYCKLLKKYENFYLVIVTTQKEKTGPNKLTTRQIIERQNLTATFPNLLLFDYPNESGYMAHQVNYAIKKIMAKGQNNRAENWFFILNIDSLYDDNAISLIMAQIGVSALNDKKVYQFSSVFLSNFNTFGTDAASWFKKAAAIFQSRWTLTHEINRYLTNTTNNLTGRCQFAHAVGHGLLISGPTFIKYPMPENVLVEDTLLGIKMRLDGYKIIPLPCLELGDSPNTITGYFKQKYTWSFGPLSATSYCLKRLFYPKLKISERLLTFIMLTQGFLNVLNWQLSSWCFIFLIVSFFFTALNYKILIILSITLYSIDYLMSIKFFQNKKYIKLPTKDAFIIFWFLWPVILTHSMPANYAVFKLLLQKIKITNIKKYKTEH